MRIITQLTHTLKNIEVKPQAQLHCSVCASATHAFMEPYYRKLITDHGVLAMAVKVKCLPDFSTDGYNIHI